MLQKKWILGNLLALPGILARLASQMWLQHQFVRKSLIPKAHQLSPQAKLSSRDIRYSVGVCVLAQGFCLLRGKAMSLRERAACTYTASLTGIFDDFIEGKYQLTTSAEELLLNPADRPGQPPLQALLLGLYREALHYAADPKTLQQDALAMIDIQIQSQSQTYPDIRLDKIREITYAKGGKAAWYYRNTFWPQMQDREQEMLFYLGAAYQVMDDAFDVYEDYHAGIQTLATKATDVGEIIGEYDQILEKIITLAWQMPYPATNIRRFLKFHALFLSVAFVCFAMLKKRQAQKGLPFSVTRFSRKELICDMEKPINRLRVIGYFLRMNIENPKTCYI